MRFNENVLMFESCTDSPVVHVKRVVEVEIQRGVLGDEIDVKVILSEDEGFTKRVAFGERVTCPVDNGSVSATRVSGDGPITVILYQE